MSVSLVTWRLFGRCCFTAPTDGAWIGGVELLSLACDYPSGLCQEAACLLRIELHKQVEDGILKQPPLDQMTQPAGWYISEEGGPQDR